MMHDEGSVVSTDAEEGNPTDESNYNVGHYADTTTNAVSEHLQGSSNEFGWNGFDLVCKLTFLISLVVISGLVAVGVLLAKTSVDNDSNSYPTNPSLNEMEDYFDYLFQLLLPQVHSLKDPQSPAYEALQWMAFEDNMILQDITQIRQRYALLVLYFATGGVDFWDGAEWLRPGVSECEFQGVACNDETDTTLQIVTGLELHQRQLVGELPSQVAWLTSLEVLNLRHNRLRGTLPSSLFTELTDLQYLEVSFNELTGSLPKDWSALTRLEAFSCRSNYLTGRLPSYWPTTLEYFTVTSNLFSGEIPSEIFQTHDYKLQVVDLGDNNFLSGTIPPAIGHSWRHLQSLGLYQTQLGGHLPSELGLLPLEELSLGKTNIYGTIPDELYRLSNLQWFVVTETLLEGTLSSDVGQLSNLAVLNFVHTRISGTIPSEVGLMSNLEWLQLAHTQIEGTLPTELSNLSSLSKYCTVPFARE